MPHSGNGYLGLAGLKLFGSSVHTALMCMYVASKKPYTDPLARSLYCEERAFLLYLGTVLDHLLTPSNTIAKSKVRRHRWENPMCISGVDREFVAE